MSERLNEVTAKMEKLGLVILKDENGRYVKEATVILRLTVRILSQYLQMQ